MEGDSTTSDLAARRAAVEDACAALAGLDEVLYQAGGDQLGPLLTLLDRLGMAAELGRVHVTAEAIARGETGTRGSATTPAQWVRAHAPSTRAGGAAQIVTLARELAKTVNAPVLTAVTDGHLPLRSAAAVIDEADRLRPLLADGAEAAVFSGLITMAAEHGPRGVRMVRPRLLAQYGLEDQLQRDQDATAGFIALSQPRPHGSGIYEYLLTLDTEGHAVLEAALGPLAAPRPTDGAPDLRSSDRRRGDALVQLVRRAVAAGESVPTTTKAQLFITMDYDRLAARLAFADSSERAPCPGLAAGTVIGGPHAGTLWAPRPSAASPATPPWSPSSSAPTTRFLTGDEPNACSPQPRPPACGCATAAAPTRAATPPPTGATPTTSSTGPTVARAICATPRSSAVTTTTSSTDDALPAAWPTVGHRHRGAIVTTRDRRPLGPPPRKLRPAPRTTASRRCSLSGGYEPWRLVA